MSARRLLGSGVLQLAAALFVSLHAFTVFASPIYPITIQMQLGLVNAPDCTLCHRDDGGGDGTVIRPFGRTMIDRFGLTGGSNITALKAAIEGDDTEHVDSDGDGVPDIDELRAGTNPNVGASGVEISDVPLPETGCSVGGLALSPASNAWWAGLFVASAYWVRRRQRSRDNAGVSRRID